MPAARAGKKSAIKGMRGVRLAVTGTFDATFEIHWAVAVTEVRRRYGNDMEKATEHGAYGPGGAPHAAAHTGFAHSKPVGGSCRTFVRPAFIKFTNLVNMAAFWQTAIAFGGRTEGTSWHSGASPGKMGGNLPGRLDSFTFVYFRLVNNRFVYLRL